VCTIAQSILDSHSFDSLTDLCEAAEMDALCCEPGVFDESALIYTFSDASRLFISSRHAEVI
jgi:hypothetical protein